MCRGQGSVPMYCSCGVMSYIAAINGMGMSQKANAGMSLLLLKSSHYN